MSPQEEVRHPAWLADLNDRQRQAATHSTGHLLVVAGAGTGKTRTLAARVAHLVASGTAPDRILLLTFTRRAAREMLDRARALLRGHGAVDDVWGGTFHSVGNRLLRLHAPAAGLDPAFTVLDQSDAADLFGLVRAELGHGDGRRRFPTGPTLAAVYSRTVNAARRLEDVVTRHFPWCGDHVEAIADIARTYVQRKRSHDVLDFDDLLLYWRALMDGAAGAAVRARFDHVLVDEYQDTNPVQADILAGLCRDGARATAVGDDAQAIYSFRSASVENMHEFPARFPGTTVVRLEQNYRSTPAILAAANAVTRPVRDEFRKRLWSLRPDGPAPLVATCDDEAAEARFVCDRVLERHEQGVALTEQAVLFRVSSASAQLEVELGRRGVPFVKYGGLRFLERAHVKDVVALLRVLDNPRDALAWHRVLLMLPGVGPAGARRLMELLGVATDGEAGDGQALRRLLHDPPTFPPRSRGAVEVLRRTLGDCGDGVPPAVQLERLRGFCAEVFPASYDNADARLADVEQLAALAGQYANRSGLVTELVLDPPVSTADLAGPPHLDDDWLVLSTIHSAKGCEWRAVHLIHASDGNLPSDMALDEPGALDEERRLLYVAMTRAKDSLDISYPLRYYHQPGASDAHSWAQPSRFLADVRTVARHIGVGRPDAPTEGPDPVVAGDTTAAVGDYLTDLLGS